MTQILVFKPGLVGDAEKRALIAAGVVPIETPDPAGVRLLEVEGAAIGGNDLFYAALSACNQSTTAEQHFTRKLLALVEAARAKSASSHHAIPKRDEKGRFLKTSSEPTP